MEHNQKTSEVLWFRHVIYGQRTHHQSVPDIGTTEELFAEHLRVAALNLNVSESIKKV